MKRSSRVSVLSVLLSHRAYKIESLVLCHLSVHIFILDADNWKAGADLITSSFFRIKQSCTVCVWFRNHVSHHAGVADKNLISDVTDASTATHMLTVCVCVSLLKAL